MSSLISQAWLAALAVVLGCSSADSQATPQFTAPSVESTRIRAAGPTRPPSPPVPRTARRVDPATLSVLEQGLRSDDYATRLIATEAMGCAPADPALPALEHQLGDPEPDVRAATILALHRHRHARAVSLLESVRDDSTEQLSLRVLAAASLVNPRPPCD